MKLRTMCLLALFLAGCGGPGEAPADTDDADNARSAAQSSAGTADANRKAVRKAPGLRGEEVTYRAGETELKGYLAYDASVDGPRPGVLVVHEWWGHNDYVRKRADMLAAMGYAALAVDMYGDGKQAGHPDDAKKFMSEVMSNMAEGERRFIAARELLAQQSYVDDSQIAAIGYCFGGAVVLHMARQGMDLAGVASFHGNLGTQSKVEEGVVKGEILVAHGADDPFVPAEQVEAFKAEMKAADVPLEFHAYPGAVHGFTSPGATELGERFDLPLAYNAEADKRSWNELDEFLERIFSN